MSQHSREEAESRDYYKCDVMKRRVLVNECTLKSMYTFYCIIFLVNARYVPIQHSRRDLN